MIHKISPEPEILLMQLIRNMSLKKQKMISWNGRRTCLVVKDITLDMTAEQAQASALSNFRKLFGMAKGGLAGMLGE